MRIFGRKANTEPTKQDIPPELKPYFNGHPFWKWLGRAAPVIVAIVLAAGIIGGSLWLRDRRAAHNSTNTQTSQQSQTPSTNNQTGTSQGNQNQPSSTTASPTDSTGGHPSSTGTAKPGSSTLLNTGPGDSAFAAALAAIAAGVLANYLRQRRAATKPR